MGRFFSRQRFGEPQFVAALLLVAFLAQCVWLVDRELGRGGVNEAELSVSSRACGNGIAPASPELRTVLLGRSPRGEQCRVRLGVQ